MRTFFLTKQTIFSVLFLFIAQFLEPTQLNAAITGPPTIYSFTASASVINSGQPTTLSWIVKNATSVSIDRGVGNVTSLSSIVVAPSVTTNYVLTARNNLGVRLAMVSVTVNPIVDVKPPTVSNVQVSGITQASATISWTTDEPADSQVEYGPTLAYGGLTPLNPSLVTTHSVQLSGLTAGTSYYYRILTKDALSNRALSAGYSFATGSAGAPNPNSAAGPVRGVTFFYLDGVNQDFPWVLENQYDPVVRQKIDAVLQGYRNAGVNWIRLLVSSNHRTYYKYLDKANPSPNPELVKQVNDFMAITRSGANAGKFTIELMLEAQQDTSGLFQDAQPYLKDKQWYAAWVSQLNYSNLGLIMFGGDLQPCAWEPAGFKCGEQSSKALVKNHALWIKEMWSWFKSVHPNLNVNYEVIGGGDVYGMLLSSQAAWIIQNTPNVPAVAASIYFDLPPGSSWQQYADVTRVILNAYRNVTSKPLWIDEYGKSISSGWTESDQASYFAGFLGAMVCSGHTQKYPSFAWVGGNDHPYNGQVWFGLISKFINNIPEWRRAWNSVSLYYNLEVCP